MAALGWWVKTPKPALPNCDLRAGAPGEDRFGSTRWVGGSRPPSQRYRTVTLCDARDGFLHGFLHDFLHFFYIQTQSD